MRILGITPNVHGIGFAVLEKDNKLVDWGTKYLPNRHKFSLPSNPICKASQQRQINKNYLKIVENLIVFYKPRVLVFENWTAKDCKRSVRYKKLLHRISLLAMKMEIPANTYSPTQVRDHFAEFQVATKHEIATFLAYLFPVLLPFLPRKRRAWTSEDVRMNIFVALSFCLIRSDK